jgi:hypothetical protein
MIETSNDFRHPELVSGSMPHCLREIGTIEFGTAIEAWMLKQVQHDGER